MKALVVYANGSEDLEVTSITDILNRGHVEVTKAAVTSEDLPIVTLAHGTKVLCDKKIEDCNDDYDVIAIPGGIPGADHCRDCKPLITKLKAQKEAHKYIAAICAAPGFVLATHGLIDDAKATGYPGCSDNVKHYVNEGVVVDKEHKVITGQGPAFCMEFAFAILQELTGEENCLQVKKGMLVK